MESLENDLPAIPRTFMRHFGESTPALEYNTPVSVCFRNGEVKDGVLDDFDFEAKHEGYLSEITGYRLRSVSVAEEQKEHHLGSLGRAFGIPYVKFCADGKPEGYGITNLGQATAQPTQYMKEQQAMHPMDRAEPQSKATRDNQIPVDRPSDEEKSAMYSVSDDYKSLSDVLERAYQQAAHGKGRERHAQDQPFNEQPMQTISQLVGSSDGLRYQAIKKIQEAGRMDKDAAIRELLGAINYIAGTIIYMERDK